MRRIRQLLVVAVLEMLLVPRLTLGFSPSAASMAPCRRQSVVLQRSFYDDIGDEESKDKAADDDEIDPDSLGDWRLFRKNLASSASSLLDDDGGNVSLPSSVTTSERPRAVSKLNAQILRTQSKSLHDEYIKEVWAHTIATPEVGGLMVRLPLEAELFRNYRHSIAGANLRLALSKSKQKSLLAFTDNDKESQDPPHLWFSKAQKLVEREMRHIAELGGPDGSIDASTLNDERAEILSLYLDYQETWQEVCLCLERHEAQGTASTLVLNRPMAFKLTDHLARLCLYGAIEAEQRRQTIADKADADVIKFMLAFRQECAVYVGGPDDQDKPADIVHGIAGLPGAVEISAGTGIFRGGLKAAVDGVLTGAYKPLDFRFFVGKHNYEESMLDVSVVLGKYQPIACSRSLVLKQCISLPKPLWHEVLEISGGEMKELSRLEHNKKEDLQFEIVDDDEDEEGVDESDEYEIFLTDGTLEDVVAEAFDELFIDEDDLDES